MVMSSLDKFSRNHVKNYLQGHDIEISTDALISLGKYQSKSLTQKLFLPRSELPEEKDMILHVLNHPLLVENAKNLIIHAIPCIKPYYGSDIEEVNLQILKKYKNLKRLTIQTVTEKGIVEGELIKEHSPNLSYLRIATDQFHKGTFTPFLRRVISVKHVVLGKVFFGKNPFSNSENLELVEYIPITEEDREYFKSFNNVASIDCVLSWDEIKQMNPRVEFKGHPIK